MSNQAINGQHAAFTAKHCGLSAQGLVNVDPKSYSRPGATPCQCHKQWIALQMRMTCRIYGRVIHISCDTTLVVNAAVDLEVFEEGEVLSG